MREASHSPRPFHSTLLVRTDGSAEWRLQHPGSPPEAAGPQRRGSPTFSPRSALKPSTGVTKRVRFSAHNDVQEFMEDDEAAAEELAEPPAVRQQAPCRPAAQAPPPPAPGTGLAAGDFYPFQEALASPGHAWAARTAVPASPGAAAYGAPPPAYSPPVAAAMPYSPYQPVACPFPFEQQTQQPPQMLHPYPASPGMPPAGPGWQALDSSWLPGVVPTLPGGQQQLPSYQPALPQQPLQVSSGNGSIPAAQHCYQPPPALAPTTAGGEQPQRQREVRELGLGSAQIQVHANAVAISLAAPAGEQAGASPSTLRPMRPAAVAPEAGAQPGQLAAPATADPAPAPPRGPPPTAPTSASTPATSPAQPAAKPQTASSEMQTETSAAPEAAPPPAEQRAQPGLAAARLPSLPLPLPAAAPAPAPSQLAAHRAHPPQQPGGGGLAQRPLDAAEPSIDGGDLSCWGRTHMEDSYFEDGATTTSSLSSGLSPRESRPRREPWDHAQALQVRSWVYLAPECLPGRVGISERRREQPLAALPGLSVFTYRNGP